jgi:hypothetical protein
MEIKKGIDMASTFLDIFNPNSENVQAILDWLMPDFDPKELGRLLKYFYAYLDTGNEKYIPYFDPVPLLFSQYNGIQKHQRVMRRLGLQWWKYIQQYVSDPAYVVKMVGRKKPEIENLLSTELGQKFIEYYTERLYNFFDLWFHKFPRYHNNCGGFILYGQVNKVANAWGFYCRRCKTVIPVDKLEEITYHKRKHHGGKKSA